MRPGADERTILQRNLFRFLHEEVVGRTDGEGCVGRLVAAVDPPERLQPEQFARRSAQVGPLAAGVTVGMPAFCPPFGWQPGIVQAIAQGGLAGLEDPRPRVVTDPPEGRVAAETEHLSAATQVGFDTVAHAIGPVFVMADDHQSREPVEQGRLRRRARRR